MRKPLDLLMAQVLTDYFSPHSRCAFVETSTNELIILNAREFLADSRCATKVFYSEAIFDFSSRLIISLPKSERRFLK